MLKAKNRNLRKLNNKGFTLGEIMIVLVIIGAIMGIILPKINDGRHNSEVRNTRMKMTDIDTKISEYQSDCGKLPTSLDFLTTDDSSCRNWTSNKANKSMMKDMWNTDFQYEVKGNGYILKSFGMDKKEGGEGFDKDIYSEGSAEE